MDPTQYRDAVVANRREQGFETVDEYTNGFDPVWAARDDDPSVGECVALATLVDESDPDPDDITAIADEFRDVLVERVDDRRGRRRRSGTSPSPCGTPISRSSTRRGRTRSPAAGPTSFPSCTTAKRRRCTDTRSRG